MRIIVLAAGQDNILDGMVKCLIRHPEDGKTILDHIIESSCGLPLTVVVGYKALEIIELYPNLDYVINKEWAVTNNAYSLGLALDEKPCIVMPGDIFINGQTIQLLLNSASDCALASKRENRGPTAVHANAANGFIKEIYTGPLHDPSDVELLGLFKLSTPVIINAWAKSCFSHSNLFCGQTLPVSPTFPPIATVFMENGCVYHEINTVADYLRLVQACKLPRN